MSINCVVSRSRSWHKVVPSPRQPRHSPRICQLCAQHYTGHEAVITTHNISPCIQSIVSSPPDESVQDPERARMENLNYLLSKVFDGWRMATNKVLITEPSPSSVPWSPPALATSPLLMVSGWSPLHQAAPGRCKQGGQMSMSYFCPRQCSVRVLVREQYGSVITVIARTNNQHTAASRAKIAHRQLVIELGQRIRIYNSI